MVNSYLNLTRHFKTKKRFCHKNSLPFIKKQAQTKVKHKKNHKTTTKTALSKRKIVEKTT